MKELKSHLRSYNTVLSNNLFFYETISKKQLTQTKIYDIFIMQTICMSSCGTNLAYNISKIHIGKFQQLKHSKSH